MKVRVASKVPMVSVGSGDLKGKELVASADGVGFSSYELHVPRGKATLTSPLGAEYNHVYYVIQGSGRVSLAGGAGQDYEAGLCFALTGNMEGALESRSTTRLFVTYVKKAAGDEQPSKPAVLRLADIIGTERDIDFTHGRSRRFLRKDDGFNVSVHNTLCYKNLTSPLVYRRNFELAYFVKGDLTYSWDDGAKSHHFKQTNVADGGGCAFLMDQNDTHELRAQTQDSEAICVFYPPLLGTETHDFSRQGHSGF